jgi:hypothetical protein
MYDARVAEEQLASERANQEVRAYVENLIKPTASKEQEVSPQDGGGNTPPDQDQLRDGTKEGQPEDHTTTAGGTTETAA